MSKKRFRPAPVSTARLYTTAEAAAAHGFTTSRLRTLARLRKIKPAARGVWTAEQVDALKPGRPGNPNFRKPT